MDVLEKKLKHKCQQLETVTAVKENLEHECERLKNEQVVCAVNKIFYCDQSEDTDHDSR